MYVTGAKGFLGQYVLDGLNETGVTTIGVSRSEGADIQVADYGELAPEKGATLVHLAEDARMQADGVQCTETLDSLLQNSWRHVVYASSAAVYGDQSGSPHAESDPAIPTTSYGKAKLANEALLEKVGGTALRLTNLIGPPVKAETILGAILSQLANDGPIRLRTTEAIRDYLFVADAAQAVLKAVQSATPGVFNIATGKSLSSRSFARALLDLDGQSTRPIEGPAGPFSVLRLDVSKAEEKLGWRAETSLDESLSRILAG